MVVGYMVGFAQLVGSWADVMVKETISWGRRGARSFVIDKDHWQGKQGNNKKGITIRRVEEDSIPEEGSESYQTFEL